MISLVKKYGTRRNGLLDSFSAFFYDYEIKDFGNGYKKQVQTGFETYDSYNLWESYDDIVIKIS
ncbi:hypothetical protein SB689_07700 [Chryseobacterium sp. SIMBA_038]